MTSYIARVRDFRQLYQGPLGLFWIRRVNHPAGAVIALALLRTAVTPNMVTAAGLVASVLGAVIVVALPAPAPIPGIVAVLLVWQLAFSLDCADGQLARARGVASPFGAWFDQLVDVMSHGAVYAALSVYLVRALGPDPGIAVALASLSVSLSLLQVFTTWQRASLLGSGPATGSGSTRAGRMIYAFRHLLDYGAFLFAVSVLLLWPPGLVGYLAFMAAVHALYVMAQLALNRRRQVPDPPAGTLSHE